MSHLTKHPNHEEEFHRALQQLDQDQSLGVVTTLIRSLQSLDEQHNTKLSALLSWFRLDQHPVW